MLYNKRGGLYLLPKLQTYANSVASIMTTLAEGEPDINGWVSSLAVPSLIRLCDEPADLIQPASPALVLTYTGRSVEQAQIMYSYQVAVSYVYASPIERAWGDDALFACMLAAEAVYQASREARPEGVYSINYNGHDISSMMTTSGTTPLLSRIMTADLEFQMEEDF